MNLIKKIQSAVSSDVLPLSIIQEVLKDKTDNAIRSLLKRACQKGDLIRVRQGLYLIGDEKKRNHYNSFQISNHIITPSYVSLESALSHYGLIPEAVYTTTSVTTKMTSKQQSSVGNFSFSHLKTKYFNFGFYQINEDNARYLIATPLKALMDYIILRKKFYSNISEIEEDLRLNWNELLLYKDHVNIEKINEMLNRYQSYRLQVILKDIRKNL